MQIGFEDLENLRKKYEGKKIVFCSGTFDLTHIGHAMFFEECKRLGDILVVAVGNDQTIKKYKGDKRPILNERIRLKTVDLFKPVDYSLLDLTPTNEDLIAPLFPIFEKLKPDIWAINEDAFNIEIRKKAAEKFNINLVILQDRDIREREFKEITTSDIINRVKSVG